MIGESNSINNSYVGINATDIMKKNEVAILGLIWHLILWYSVEDHRSSLNSAADKAKEALLGWLQRLLPPPDHDIVAVTLGWQDGKQLAALINVLKPGAINPSIAISASPLELTQYCIKIARLLEFSLH